MTKTANKDKGTVNELTANSCCGDPAPGNGSGCCIRDADAKAAGASGCGCGSTGDPKRVCCA